jgi:hypothetical protein
MKKIFLPILFSFITYSCSEINKDCLCTEEFRSYFVTVVDTIGVPVDSLDATVRDKNGFEINVLQPPYHFSEGIYTVLDDSFKEIFYSSTLPEKFYFSATDGSRTAAGEYLFNIDECNCHIYKVSGPDTLVLR